MGGQFDKNLDTNDTTAKGNWCLWCCEPANLTKT